MRTLTQEEIELGLTEDYLVRTEFINACKAILGEKTFKEIVGVYTPTYKANKLFRTVLLKILFDKLDNKDVDLFRETAWLKTEKLRRNLNDPTYTLI